MNNRFTIGCSSAEVLAFVEEIINIVKRDQFVEVNKIVPSFVNHAQAIPPELYKEYVLALLGQARSSSDAGAPAAKRALEPLPEAIAEAGIPGMDEEFVVWNSREEYPKKFVPQFRRLGNASQQKLFGIFSICRTVFMTRYLSNDFSRTVVGNQIHQLLKFGVAPPS